MKTYTLNVDLMDAHVVTLMNKGYTTTKNIDGSITVMDPVYGYKNGIYQVTHHENVTLKNSRDVSRFLIARS